MSGLTWFIIISWVLVGLISVLFCWCTDMRGKEFDPHYFEEEGMIFASIITILIGYFAPIFILLCCIPLPEKPFTRLLYKLANIGVKKEHDKN